MKTTFTFELQNKPTSAGQYPVYIRITKDRKHKRIKTTIALKKKSDWNPKAKEIRTSEKHSQAWNEQLEKELEEAKQTYRDNRDSSLDALVGTIKDREVSESFISFAEAKIEEARATESIGTYRHYKSTLKMLQSYLKARKKRWNGW